MTWCWCRTTRVWPPAVAAWAVLLASANSFAQADSGSSTSFSLLYEADPGCPERSSLVRQFREHVPLVELTEQPSVRVIRITAHVGAGHAWGEVQVGQAGGAPVPRRVEAGDCAAAVKALVLIAVVAVDPTGSQQSTVGATAESDAAFGSESAHDSDAASDSDTAREAGALTATGEESDELPRDPELPPDPERRRGPARGAAGVPSSAKPDLPSRHWERFASKPEAQARSGARRSSGWTIAVVGAAAARTPEAPDPLVAALVGAEVRFGRAGAPAARLLGGFGENPALRADTADLRLRLWFARAEASPGRIRFGSFSLRSWLGFEAGSLGARIMGSPDALSETGKVVTPWLAFTQSLRVECPLGRGFEAELGVGAIEPLRRDSFIVDRPHRVIHRVSGFGAMADVQVAYRFE